MDARCPRCGRARLEPAVLHVERDLGVVPVMGKICASCGWKDPKELGTP